MSLRKYPKAIAGRVPLFHPAMKPFQSLPWIRISPWYQFVAIGVFISIILLSLLVMEVGHWEKGLPGLIVVVIAFTIALPTCYQIVMRLSKMLMVRQANEDRASFKATEEERHVGIAYCDHSWVFREDTSWDRGFLRIETDLAPPQMNENGWGRIEPDQDTMSLCFRGFGPEFRLPLTAISDTWIAMQSMVFNNTPRLYIRWNHPESGPNVMCLEHRAYNSLVEAIAETENLKQWIDEARSNAKEPSADPIWPFQSAALDFAKDPEKQKVEPIDRAMGFLAAFVIFLICFGIGVALKKLFNLDIGGGVTGGASVFMIAAYYGVINHRVVKRGAGR